MKKTLLGTAATMLIVGGAFTTNLTANEVIKRFKSQPDPATCTLESLEQAGIGDVKYSILTEADFQKVNGTEWVLLKGQTMAEINYAPYDKLNGTIETVVDVAGQPNVYHADYVNLPDARGIFLRGENGGTTRNPDTLIKMGEYQADSYEAHTHGALGTWLLGNAPGNRYAATTGGFGNDDPGNAIVQPAGGNETRSKNVTVNIFVKIRRGCINQALEDKFVAFQAKIDEAEAAVQALKCGPIDTATYPNGCFEMPETNEAEKHSKVTCLETGLVEWEGDNNLKFWSHNCVIQTVATSKRILIDLADSKTPDEETYFNRIVFKYPYYNDVSWKAEAK